MVNSGNASRFWDRMANSYARQPIADEAAYQTKLEITRTYFSPEMELLELGCGTGSTALLHAPYVRHIRAVDFSEKMVGIARAKAAAQGVGNVTFEQGDVTTVWARDDSIDMVLTLSLLHLLKDPGALVARIHRMLKPGGIFVSSTACLGDTMAFFKAIAPLGGALGLLPTINVMRRKDLVAMIAGAGFAIEHDWQPGKGKAVFIVARK